MTHKDQLGNVMSGASGTAIEHYDQALHELQCYIGDPVGSIDRALEDSPAFVMGHVLRGYLHLLGTESAGLPVARAAHQAAIEAALPVTSGERAHIEAMACLIEGHWHDAGRILEDVAIDHPRDPLALQAGHLIDFYTGSSRMLRDRIARALPAWDARMPGYHAILGMHAFGLEETGLYDRAEAEGRRAVEIEPRDGWSQHAVAHVMEMQGRQRDGLRWMRDNPDAWSRESFFCVHNWWHVALFHLDLCEIDEVLILFDAPIYGKRSQVVLDMVDASALLWRLHLRGVDVGDRWQPVADAWAPIAASGNYAFNDAHAMMAFVGAGREDAVRDVFEAQARALAGSCDNAMFTRDVGAPLAHAIHAFGAGKYGRVVDLLRPVRIIASRFGGSHAQRDLIDLTLLEAAIRDGRRSMARALAAERLNVKPASPSARILVERAA